MSNIATKGDAGGGAHHTELFQDYSNELLNFASVACIIFIVVGVPGNLLTIVALIRSKQTLNSTAIFIINLSLSDLLFCCFNLPLAASTFLRRAWAHSDLLCRLFPLLRYGLLAVSLFTVSLITINRYIIIAHPRQYPRIYQRRHLGLMIASTWITAFVMLAPTWHGIWGRFGLDVTIGSCTILHDANGHSPKEFLFVAAFMVPCLCIVLCYARIFYLVRKAAIRTREPLPKSTSFRNGNGNGNGQGNSGAGTGGRYQAPQEAKPSEDTNAGKLLRPPGAGAGMGAGVGVGAISEPPQPFFVDEDLAYIDVSDSNDEMPISYSLHRQRSKSNKPKVDSQQTMPSSPNPTAINTLIPLQDDKVTKSTGGSMDSSSNQRPNPSLVTTSIRTSFTRFSPRKMHHVSMGNNSNASSIYPGKMSQKDKRLLKMILVIFVAFVICYLPITITKIWKSTNKMHVVNVSGYLLIYLTTCINPIIYVLMSQEYRQAYWNLLRCHLGRRRQQQQLLKKELNHTPKA